MIDYREATETATVDSYDDYGLIVYYTSPDPRPVFIPIPGPGLDFQNKSPPVLVPNGETLRLPLRNRPDVWPGYGIRQKFK